MTRPGPFGPPWDGLRDLVSEHEDRIARVERENQRDRATSDATYNQMQERLAKLANLVQELLARVEEVERHPMRNAERRDGE